MTWGFHNSMPVHFWTIVFDPHVPLAVQLTPLIRSDYWSAGTANSLAYKQEYPEMVENAHRWPQTPKRGLHMATMSSRSISIKSPLLCLITDHFQTKYVILSITARNFQACPYVIYLCNFSPLLKLCTNILDLHWDCGHFCVYRTEVLWCYFEWFTQYFMLQETTEKK